MGRRETTIADLLIQSAREAAAHAQGDSTLQRRTKVTRRSLNERKVSVRSPHAFDPKRVRAIRDRLNASQSVFADLLNVSAATVRSWEQGQRAPDGPSLRLLEIAEQEPAALLRLAAPQGLSAAKS